MISNLRKRKNDRGFVLVLTAICGMVLVLMVGFAVDLGSWFLTASRLQRSADAAALTAAISMPDATTAANDANDAYQKNGYTNGQNNIAITNDASGPGFRTSITDSKVPTYFLQAVFKDISITRTSVARARASGGGPKIGSPFNVLGTGELTMPGMSAPQNFWLAINGMCSAKEDGDYFNTKYDGNKGPFTSTVDSNGNFQPTSNGHTECTGSQGELNPDYTPLGYSYYVDIPPAPPGGTVKIAVFHAARNSSDSEAGAYPDHNDNIGKDDAYGAHHQAWELWKSPPDTPDDFTDDTKITEPLQTDGDDPRVPDMGWWELATLQYNDIKDGGLFRIQSFTANSDVEDSGEYQAHAFAIGAFPSWIGDGKVCDTRLLPDTCPKVYARSAESVLSDFQSVPPGGNIDFYFASFDPTYAGQTFDVELWDVGEGTSKVQLIGPDNNPLTFDWSSPVAGGVGYSGTGVNFIDTSGTGPLAQPSISNPFKFNDRLITVKVTIPSTWPATVAAAGGDSYIRLRYTGGSALRDRTTWGLNIGGKTGSSGGVRLVDPNS